MKLGYYDKAKRYLEEIPPARKLDNRARACWGLVKKYINPNLETLDKDTFIKYFSNFQSFDRAIRDVQSDCPHLTDSQNEINKQQAEVDALEILGYNI